MKTRFFSLLVGLWMPAAGFCQEQALTGNTGIAVNENIRFAPQEARLDFDRERVYKLKPAVDIPVTVVGAAWSGYAFGKIYGKDPIPYETVAGLTDDDVNAFDRWAAGKSDPAMDDASDYLFYGSMPLPALLYIDRKIRKDAAKIGFLYLESFAITGLLYTGSVYFVDRYRPETYDTRIPVEDRTNGNNKNSFPAGHVAVVSNATFFMAKVYSDYHPESKWKWAFWGGAAAATGTMIYMRHAAGKHFPSDLIAGAAIGTLSGILVPHFHKNKDLDGQAWHIGPYMNGNYDGYGLSFTYRFR